VFKHQFRWKNRQRVRMGDVDGLLPWAAATEVELGGKSPTIHPHTMEQVAGLIAALNGKADSPHIHSASDVFGLVAALVDLQG
jgi:hypothetical protein